MNRVCNIWVWNLKTLNPKLDRHETYVCQILINFEISRMKIRILIKFSKHSLFSFTFIVGSNSPVKTYKKFSSVFGGYTTELFFCVHTRWAFQKINYLLFKVPILFHPPSPLWYTPRVHLFLVCPTPRVVLKFRAKFGSFALIVFKPLSWITFLVVSTTKKTDTSKNNYTKTPQKRKEKMLVFRV